MSARPPSTVDLYGIWLQGHWWCDDHGVIFYTVHRIVAELQARELASKGADKPEVKRLTLGV